MTTTETLSLRFLFDEHVHVQALKQLQGRGVDVIRVSDVELSHTEDAVIFAWASREQRILVTRNYNDFAPLVAEANRQDRRFPGVLFCAPSLPQSDAGAHVRALERWLSDARASGVNPVENTYGWLRPA